MTAQAAGVYAILDYMQLLVFWLGLGIITFSYMSLWFGLALYTKRYDVVDSAWGLGFVLVAWISLALMSTWNVVSVISATLVSLWGVRLFAHIANRNWRKHEDDHRYEALRAAWGSKEKQKAYTNVFLLQGVLILAVSLPMIAIARSGHSQLNIGIVLGWSIWLVGILIEAVADRQLAQFIKNRPAGSHHIMQTGLWRYSRHPNYFGEVTTWCGAGIVTVSVGSWWGLFGTAVITVLITRISGIPPLEKHYKNNEAYQRYAKKTSVFVPLPVKK